MKNDVELNSFVLLTSMICLFYLQNHQNTKTIEQKRSIASHEISRNLRLFSEEPRCIKKDSNSLR